MAVSRPVEYQERPSRSKAQAIERLHSADNVLAEALDLDELDEIVSEAERGAIAIGTVSRPRASSLTGERPVQPAEAARARKLNLFRAFRQRQELLADSFDVGDVAELLGVGRQTPHDRVRASTLLAIKDQGRLRFPAWQFDSEGPDGVVAGLPTVMRALKGPMSELGRVRWFTTPQSLLDGKTPLQALREGDVEAVVRAAEAVGVS